MSKEYVNSSEILVGSSLACIHRAYKEKKKMVLTNFNGPTQEKFLQNEIIINNTNFHKELDCWQYLKFLCCMQGLIINPRSPSSVRLDKDSIKVIYSDNVIEISFDKCHYYIDGSVKCSLQIESVIDEDKYKVIDFMKLRVGSHSGVWHKNINMLHIESVFLEDSNVFCRSFLNSKQLKDPECSDIISRFVVQKVLEEFDVVTLPYVDSDKNFKRKLKLEVTERLVVPMQREVYVNTEKIICYE